MAVPVLLFERLLVQQEVELVQLGQVGGVRPLVRLVRVRLQGDVGPALANGGDRFDVPAGLDLQLDAPVALVDVAGDLVGGVAIAIVAALAAALARELGERVESVAKRRRAVVLVAAALVTAALAVGYRIVTVSTDGGYVLERKSA